MYTSQGWYCTRLLVFYSWQILEHQFSSSFSWKAEKFKQSPSGHGEALLFLIVIVATPGDSRCVLPWTASHGSQTAHPCQFI